MTEKELQQLGEKIIAYCNKFFIPPQFLLEILEDQKVTPMIRGKAMEYNTFLLLTDILDSHAWSVQKLNLNAQPGAGDEDVSLTHKRSGVILKIECKSAVRGSVKSGEHSRSIRVPHFNVKCHRSRSNIRLAKTSNDKYSVDSFDVIITNPLNAIYEGNTVGENLELVHDAATCKMLYQHYNCTDSTDLIKKCAADWRYCLPSNIAVDGYIPRTPSVLLVNDPHWRPIGELEKRLLQVVSIRIASKRNTQTRRT